MEIRKIASVAALSVFATVASGETSTAKWSFQSESDALTDATLSRASITYSEGVYTRGAYVRCKGNQLETVVYFGEFLNSRDPVTLQYRIDKQPVVSAAWYPSATGDAIFATDPVDVARSLIGGTSTFIVEADDYRGQPHRVTFVLDEAKEVISKVLEACHYTLEPLSASVPGLRPELSSQLESWGPRHILDAKQILTANKAYAGPIDSKMDGTFALAVQKFYDDYMDSCRNGDESDIQCTVYLQLQKAGANKPSMPNLIILLWIKATGDVKTEFVGLKARE